MAGTLQWRRTQLSSPIQIDSSKSPCVTSMINGFCSRFIRLLIAIAIPLSVAATNAAAAPDLTVTMRHIESFAQGETGKRYTIAVNNIGDAPTAGTVTVTGTLPVGLTASTMAGSGWSCNVGTLTCTRTEPIAAAATSVIVLSVNVANDAPFHVTSGATVSGGGETVTTNNSAADRTVIHPTGTCALFSMPVDHPVGGDARSIVSADFNADGKADVAVSRVNPQAPSGAGSVAVLMGNGDGSFAAAVPYTVGIRPQDLVVADINGDAKLDLVVANFQSSSLSILVGNGDGTFAAAVSIAAGTEPIYLKAGDFNGDTNSDLVVGWPNSSNVGIMLGRGDGTFAVPVSYGVPASVRAIAVGDFNGDGRSDLAVGTYGSLALSLLYGNGNGTFGSAVNYNIGAEPISIAVGDFNGDGRSDLAVGKQDSSLVAILLGDASGISGTVNHIYITGSPAAIVVGDFDGDGRADLAARGEPELGVATGNGAGGFTGSRRSYTFSTLGSGALSANDFNGDGKADLAVTTAFFSENMSVLLAGCPDLRITKTHVGDFTQGQQGATYTISVSNIGTVHAFRPVNVFDTLPPELTATSMSGAGVGFWSCSVQSVGCTSTALLAPGDTLPPITLTVTVSSSAPPTVTNSVIVISEVDIDASNDTATDPTTILGKPDLTVTKTHAGSFAQGQTGRTYTIVVNNIGTGPSSGTVTVTDAVPSGLTPTSLTGDGWTCDLQTWTCTRTDALAGGASYPPITLTVNVHNDAPAQVVNVASVSGGNETITQNSTTSDPTTVITRPTSVVATAISTSQVYVTWNGVAGATRYQVHRSSHNSPFTMVGFPLTTTFTDTNLTPGTTYVYFVRAADSANLGLPSNMELATTILYTDDPLIAASTVMKAEHLTQLRTAVNAVRAAAGLQPTSFSNTMFAGSWILASHITELRASLNEARSELGFPALNYTDPSLQPGDVIKAAHVRELRGGAR